MSTLSPIAQRTPLANIPLSVLHAHLVQRFARSCHCIFVREPLIDPVCRASSDVDVVLLDESNELLPERHFCEPEGFGIDVVRLPARWFDEPATVAAAGLVPHRVLATRLIHDPNGFGELARARVSERFVTLEARERRVLGFLRLGADAVRETGVTLDLPGLARFWVHMTFSSLVCALADGCKLLCPNAYTRPFDLVREVERTSGLALEARAIEALGLDVPPATLEQPLEALHGLVTSRFPEPEWPAKMRLCTRYEYRYFSSRQELDYRLSVAREMSQLGTPHAAVFYLRFWAWMLTCIPLVHARAKQGIDVSFVRPQRAVGPDLELQCPEAAPLLRAVLGDGIDEAAVEKSIRCAQELRGEVLSCIGARGISPLDPPEFQPFRATASRLDHQL